MSMRKFRVGMPWCLVLRCPCLVLCGTLLGIFALIGIGATSAPISLNTDFAARRGTRTAWAGESERRIASDPESFRTPLWTLMELRRSIGTPSCRPLTPSPSDRI